MLLVGSIALAVYLGNKPAIGSNMGASMSATAAIAAGAALILAVIAAAKGDKGTSFRVGCIAAGFAACGFLSLPILGLASGNA